MNDDEKARRDSMSAAVKGTLEQFASASPETHANIKAIVPSDPKSRAKYVKALEDLSAAYPVDGPEPNYADVQREAAFKLVAVSLDQIDEVDGIDYAKSMAHAYFQLRADYICRAGTQAGNA